MYNIINVTDTEFIEMAKMVDKSHKERLIIAGALIAAEIDRIQFIENNP